MNDKSAATLFNLNVNITISLVIFSFGAVLIAGFIVFPCQQENIKFIGAVIGGLSALYSAYYVGKTLRLQVNEQRVRNSFRLLEALNDPDLIKARATLDTDFSHTQTAPVQQYDIIVKNLQLHIAVKSLLTIFTHASIAIKKDHADEMSLFMALDTLLPYTFSMLKPYVDEVRKIRGNDKVYKNAEDLANSWAAGKYLSSNKYIRGCY